MTQEELNKLPPPYNKENAWVLEKDKTNVILMVGSEIGMTLTLREVVGDKVYVQLTYDPLFATQINKRVYEL